MYCAIYNSRTRQDIYLYLVDKDDFSRVPEALLRMLGQPVHVMDLELTPERRLAQGDAREVMRTLREQGWYLQMPPKGEWAGVH